MLTQEKCTLINEVLVSLQNAGEDHEASIVEKLAIQAGYWWRCDCQWVNDTSEKQCANCNKTRGE